MDEQKVKGNPLYHAKKKKRRRLIITLLILAAVIGGLLLAHYLKTKKEGADVDTGLPENSTVEEIARRTIVNSVSATGTITSRNHEDVAGGTFGLSITSVLVSVGDVVESGQLLMTLDTSGLSETRAELMKQIADARKNQSDYHSAHDQNLADRNAEAAKRREEAEKSLAEAKQEYEEAKATLAKTQAEYDAFIAEHEGELRNRTENGAGSDPSAGDGENPELPTREDVENYLNSNDAIADQRRLLLESQRANVNSLQLRIDLLQGVLDNFLTGEATASLDNGEILKTYDETVNNTVARLQEQVTAIDERIKNGNVYSTMAGTVTAVNVTEGSTYTGQTVATIEGVDQFVVESRIDEYDIPDIRVGQKVMIKTEGTRDQELRGTVSFVSPKAGSTTSGGGLSDLSGLLGGMSSSVGDLSALTGGSSSADYLIRITMDDWNERLRLGMNAKLSIITEESPAAMAVPYEAVHEREDGTKYIEVIDEEATAKNVDEKGHTTTVLKEIDVEVGIEGTYYVEILSDEVEEGMRVIVPAASGEETVDDLLNMIGSGVGV